MNNDRKLVYSTESGALEKAMAGKKNSRKKKAPPTAPAIVNPAKQGIRIRRESKGRGGKTVSIIDGLPLDESNMKTLMKKLKAALGTGGAVKNSSLEIQGEHRERVRAYLIEQGFQVKG
ncbi:MAG TPA: translation initiation factor [Candidatus Marinimicrobia bacterium]|nr:translation initiation factor [Candidatus Neomarinimicrobiota bacterium]